MKMTTSEFAAKRFECQSKGIAVGSVWLHYKGGTYSVHGYGIDTATGEFKIGYHRIAGPGYDPVLEEGMEFYRVPSEWFETCDQNNCETQRFTLIKAG